MYLVAVRWNGLSLRQSDHEKLCFSVHHLQGYLAIARSPSVNFSFENTAASSPNRESHEAEVARVRPWRITELSPELPHTFSGITSRKVADAESTGIPRRACVMFQNFFLPSGS